MKNARDKQGYSLRNGSAEILQHDAHHRISHAADTAGPAAQDEENRAFLHDTGPGEHPLDLDVWLHFGRDSQYELPDQQTEPPGYKESGVKITKMHDGSNRSCS